jgi:hypothetical protein
MTDDKSLPPLPVQFMQPWLEDNAQYLKDMAERAAQFGHRLNILRNEHKHLIKTAEPVSRCLLGAVDAASISETYNDQMSILVQAVRVDDGGKTTLGHPQRVTGVDSLEMKLSENPMRVAEECRMLAGADGPVIADTSFYSFLMEVNMAIHRKQLMPKHQVFVDAVRSLVLDHTFIDMMQNSNVIPMSKRGQSSTLCEGISDRVVLTHMLHEGEYLSPRPFSDALDNAGLGISKDSGFNETERKSLVDLFSKQLGVIFFKPHPWSKALRIEARIDLLRNSDWIMPVLAAISHHTATNRLVSEPWPQFMADYTVKQISEVNRYLYGEANQFRFPLFTQTWQPI